MSEQMPSWVDDSPEFRAALDEERRFVADSEAVEELAEVLWQAEKDANRSGLVGYGETWSVEPVRPLYRAQAVAALAWFGAA